MKYKVGDKVRVKSLEWYNENKDEFGDVKIPNNVFVPDMSRFCGQECTICHVLEDASRNKTYYGLKEDVSGFSWTNYMFEEIVEEKTTQLLISGIIFSNKNYADKVELCLGNDYEIVVEDGRTFVQRKKPKYPKSFQECYYLLYGQQDLTFGCDIMKGAYSNLLECLQMLLICRDVYWKIADNWKPDWADNYEKIYIINFYQNEINFTNGTNAQYILSFPTKEMRDAFYENFKDLIEKCKKLL